MNKILWLASYPKSGNTWCRIFLENLLQGEENPADINQLLIQPEARRRIAEEVVGVDTSLLSVGEINELMPQVYQHWSDQAKTLVYLKTHHAYTCLPDGLPLIPTSASFGAVYLVRNPLDVVVSFAHHRNGSVSDAIDKLNNPDYCIGNESDRYLFLFHQKLLSWNQHVTSWLDNPSIKTLVIKYEDMKLKPLETFRTLAEFCQLYTSEAKLELAIENSSFTKVKGQEKESGFREKKPGSSSFFRKGEVGSWREKLSPKQVHEVIQHHGKVMKRLGYLDDAGNIIC